MKRKGNLPILMKLPGGQLRDLTITRPPGVVLATSSSPVTYRNWASADGLLCDGVNDEVEIHNAWNLAATKTGTARVVNVADGVLTTDWARTHPNNVYYSALRPPVVATEIVTRAINPGAVTIRSVIHPAAFNHTDGGQYNRFAHIPGTHPHSGSFSGATNHRWIGLIFDGRAMEQNSAVGMGSDRTWNMDGVREHGSPGFVMENCIIQNFRGTGGSGQDETTSLYLYNGRGQGITVRNTDNGQMASGYHQAFGSDASLVDCVADGGSLNRLNHGFAQNNATRPTRTRGRALHTGGSGFREEVCVDSVDTDCIAEDNAGHGFIAQCGTGHQFIRPTSRRNAQWGIGLLKATNFSVSGGTLADNGTDIMFYAAFASCPDGSASPTKATGTFSSTTYQDVPAFNPTGHATRAEYGL